MPPLAGHTATYSDNRADGDSTNIYGGLHLPGAGGPGGPATHQCLRDLRVTDPREDRARIEHDKDRLLKDCYAWILDDANFQRWGTQGNSRLMWIKGDPGKGKTMMMMGLIDELSHGKEAGQPYLLAYFFCQSTRPELNNAVSVLQGLIYLFVMQKEELMRHVQKRYEAAGKQLFEGPNAINALSEILSDILNNASLPTTYLLVDALDECTTSLSNLLHIIADESLAWRSKAKWLVTSRNVPEIERFLHSDSLGVKVSLELSASHVAKAVAAFVDFKVQRLAAVKNYDLKTRTEVQQQLRGKAEGTFLWVSLVCKELEVVPLHRTQAVLQALPPGLELLYDRMMAQILVQKDVKTANYCKDILRSITLAYGPLLLKELVVTAGLPGDQFSNVQGIIDLVSRCGSFLTIRQDIVSFIHPSAKDYFTSGGGRQVFDGTVAEEQGRVNYRPPDAQITTATQELVLLFQEHEVLQPIYKAAIASSTIGPERFARYFRRLLKVYSEDLKNEAGDSVDYLAARLVAFKARHVVESIVARYLKGPSDGNLMRGVAGKKRIEYNPLDVEEEQALSESSFQDISNIRHFLVESQAFLKLRHQLQQFAPLPELPLANQEVLGQRRWKDTERTSANMNKGKSKKKVPKPGNLWSPAEDKRLLDIVQTMRPVRWKQVALSFEHRSAYACERRYINYIINDRSTLGEAIILESSFILEPGELNFKGTTLVHTRESLAAGVKGETV
jgi:hypothetical protein